MLQGVLRGLAVVLLLSLSPSLASAKPARPPEPCKVARKLWDAANDLYKLKRYQDAELLYVWATDLCGGLGLVDSATDRSSALAEREEGFAALYFNLGQTRRLNGKAQKAIWAYQQVIKFSPRSPLAFKAQSWIEKLRRELETGAP